MNSGGHISLNRVSGRLAVTRAFGDFKYKPFSTQDKELKAKCDIVLS